MIYLVTNTTYLFEFGLFNIISLEKAISILEEFNELGLDTETKGLDPYTKELLLLQLGNNKVQIVFDINSFNNKIPQLLKDFLQSDRLFIIQNAKFDLKFLLAQDIILTKVYDTMLAEIIITHGLQYSGRDLKSIVNKYCNEELDKSIRGDIVHKELNESILLYASRDVKYLEIVKREQESIAKELDVLKAIELDNSFVVVLAYTEFFGIKLDYDKWKKVAFKNEEELLSLKKDLDNFLWEDGKVKYFTGMNTLFSEGQDCTVNWNSPKQVILIFKEYGINTTVKEKGKSKETVNASVLEPQSKDFPIIKLYLTYKEKQKEVSTYGDSWKNYINPVTGRVHTTYKQIINTGRLSSGDKFDGTPNMQNIPKSGGFRECFIPEKDFVMVDADYSSQEQVLLANFSKEENLINFYKRGFTDFHSYIAFLIYDHVRTCELEDLTPDHLKHIKDNFPEERFLAKSAGFAISYGGDGSTIAKNCNVSRDVGNFVYDSYFKAFPKMNEYFDLVFRRVDHFKYIKFNNITRRKYFIDYTINDYFVYKDIIDDPIELNAISNPFLVKKNYSAAKAEIARLAQNYPLQGSAADITKYAGVLFFSRILKNNWFGIVKIVNFVHDEILVECPKELSEEVKDLLLDCMEQAGKPFCPIIPLKAEAKIGDCWIH